MKWTLLAIAAFLVFTLGSFIWFVASWSDPDATGGRLDPPTETSAA
ncbi:hypothetical protein [Salipiger sp. IMCC34102]|nr:hypothetical protein [Salipiger sp. IMCC34102]